MEWEMVAQVIFAATAATGAIYAGFLRSARRKAPSYVYAPAKRARRRPR